MLDISGESGYNTTGASVGCIVVTDSTVMAAGNSIVQTDEAFAEPDGLLSTGSVYIEYNVRNVFISVASKNSLKAKLIWLTDYEFDGRLSA